MSQSADLAMLWSACLNPCLRVAAVAALALPLTRCSSEGDDATPPPASWTNPSDASDSDGADPSCIPATCQSLGAECGTVPDGCGGTLPCGACEEGETCGASGPNLCGVGDCEVSTCEQLNAQCGMVSDGCSAVLNCGGCAPPTSCGGGGSANTCECVATTCEAEGAECGTIPDGCGGVLECGACAGGTTCGGDGPNRCGTHPCGPKTCSQLGASCGWASDGCSTAIDCGACEEPNVCGGGGEANQCGCEAKSCTQLGASCGLLDTGCGVVDCGTCAGADTCGGGGVSNACGCSCSRPHAITECHAGNCVVLACLSGWADCNGSQSDGCEANLESSIEHCGGCGDSCSFAHASSRCVGGDCRLDACADGYADCDGYESNGCERSVNTATDCGGCGIACGDAESCSGGTCRCGNEPGCGSKEYCHEGQGCYPLPTIVFDPTCADLGADHSGPGQYHYKFTVSGRPGAEALQYNEQLSCGTAPVLAATYQLGANGTYVDLYSDVALSCISWLGKWEVFVTVDGHESNHVFATYYNANCPGAVTCAEAATYCK